MSMLLPLTQPTQSTRATRLTWTNRLTSGVITRRRTRELRAVFRWSVLRFRTSELGTGNGRKMLTADGRTCERVIGIVDLYHLEWKLGNLLHIVLTVHVYSITHFWKMISRVSSIAGDCTPLTYDSGWSVSPVPPGAAAHVYILIIIVANNVVHCSVLNGITSQCAITAFVRAFIHQFYKRHLYSALYETLPFSSNTQSIDELTLRHIHAPLVSHVPLSCRPISSVKWNGTKPINQ